VKSGIWNLPNALTLLRLVCVPVVGFLVLGADTASARWLAALVFVVASLTDMVDGAVARARAQITAIGTLLDPIVDKALTGMALVALSIIGEVAWWITIVIMVREIGVTALRLLVVRTAVIPASPGGKVKTIVQIVAITMLLVPLTQVRAWDVAAHFALWVALVVTIVTGVDYVIRFARVRSAG
jgi:CDP-diacylglycerol--glycerol-3-phosphate 3-phosphatidyltransferase